MIVGRGLQVLPVAGWHFDLDGIVVVCAEMQVLQVAGLPFFNFFRWHEIADGYPLH